LPSYRIPEEVEAGIDAIEVWNARATTLATCPTQGDPRLLQRIRARRPESVGNLPDWISNEQPERTVRPG
jgi:hypothetical protein